MNLEQVVKEYPIGTTVRHNGWLGRTFTVVDYIYHTTNPHSEAGLRASCSNMKGVLNFHQFERVTIVKKPNPYTDEDWV